MTKQRHKLKAKRNPGDRAILIFCMGLALVFWLVAKLSIGEYVTQTPVSIEYQLKEGNALFTSPPKTLILSVQGRGWDLLKLLYFTPRPKLSIQARSSTSVIYSLNQIEGLTRGLLPAGLRLVGMSPETFVVATDQLVVKMIPVVIDAKITAAEGYGLIEPWGLTPDSITVSGPRSVVDTLNYWETELVVRQNIKETAVTGSIKLKHHLNEGIVFEPTVVRYEVKAEKQLSVSLLVPVSLVNVPTGTNLTFSPDTVELTCKVPERWADSLQANLFSVVGDYSEAQMGDGQSLLRVFCTRMPVYAKIEQCEPDAIKVMLKR